jgi:hypothetical protein
VSMYSVEYVVWLRLQQYRVATKSLFRKITACLCYLPFSEHCLTLSNAFLSQLANTATSSPTDDVPHYVIPPKLLLTHRFYFQQTSGIHAPVGKRKVCSLSGRSPASIADSFNVANMTRKHSMLNLREINKNNKHTALASVWTYYGWVSLIF